MKILPTLGELEIQVMHCMWQEQPCTERTIWERIRDDRPVGRTTVLKTLQRLEGKGLITRVAAEGPVRYRATVAEGRLLPAMIRRFVDSTLGGSLEPFVAYLAGSQKLSAKDLAALRSIARKMAGEEPRDE